VEVREQHHAQAALIPGKNYDTYRIEGSMGPIGGLEVFEKR